MTLAHVGGLPLEETLPTLTPLAFALVFFARVRLGGMCRRLESLAKSRRQLIGR